MERIRARNLYGKFNVTILDRIFTVHFIYT